MIVASGKGALAETIRRIASEAGVAVIEDSMLTDGLIELDVGTLIPPDYYRIVAELLVFVGSVADDREVPS